MKTIMYCHVVGEKYMHFYKLKQVVQLCGSYPIVKVRVESTDSEDSYWAWWSNVDEKFRHVYYTKGLVEMCFPYAVKSYEDAGEGKLLPVTVKEI